MRFYKKILLLLITLTLFSCGRNDQKEEETPNKTEQNNTIKSNKNSEEVSKDTVYNTPEDSIRAVKESILRKQAYKKKEETETETSSTNTASKPTTTKPANNKKPVPSFVYIKKILNECEIGVPLTAKDLEAKYNIPEEAIGLVKSLTKISENEVDIKWKSTWLIEKVSDAKFTDGRMKMRFENNKMYTSGGAIAIKYEKKTYSDLILIGRNAYIPSVKGYHWQIGKD